MSTTLDPESPPSEPASEVDRPLKRSAKGAPGKSVSNTTDLYWQVPGESVEVYHIYYGSTPTNLDRHIAIKTVDLEKFPSAEYGAVFRYQLAISKSETVYLKIVAENRFGKSNNSQLIKISNGKQEVAKQ